MAMSVPITKGKFAIVDDADYESVSKWKWAYCRDGYARRTKYIGVVDGKEKSRKIAMHREITNAAIGMEVDHINMDRLDNRRENLRVCTTTQNKMNRKSYSGSISKYKGVGWRKDTKKWVGRIVVNKKQKILGNFKSEIEAAKAYNEAAIKMFGKFARLNMIGE